MNTQTSSEDKILNQLGELIISYQFDEAEKLIDSYIRESQIIRILHYLTEQKTGILSYTFVNYLIQKHHSAFWHRVAACITSESLDHVSQGHKAGLYHSLKAIELNPDDYLLKEYALSFYSEGFMDKALAKEFAQAVLEKEPNNKLALKILNDAN